MAIGYYQDPFPRGRVAMRGWDPQNPTKQTIALPVNTTTDEGGRIVPEWIWPGHLMFPTADGTAWTKNPTNPTVIAVAQDASTDPDVVAANSLVGLACSDAFKLATPFFRRGADDNYAFGTPLTYCTTDDEDENTNGGKSLEGWIKPAGETDPVIGYVCGTVHDGVNGSENLQSSFVTATDSMAAKSNSYLVVWNTSWKPAATPTA